MISISTFTSRRVTATQLGISLFSANVIEKYTVVQKGENQRHSSRWLFHSELKRID